VVVIWLRREGFADFAAEMVGGEVEGFDVGWVLGYMYVNMCAYVQSVAKCMVSFA
jgi:hypothetical protein